MRSQESLERRRSVDWARKRGQGGLSFDARSVCHQKFGVDLTATALTILSEIGPDFSRFPTSAAFCALGRRSAQHPHHRRQADPLTRHAHR
jgi:hypothetical protein